MARMDWIVRHWSTAGTYSACLGGGSQRSSDESRWHGGNAESSVLEFRRAGANRAHPTAKPVGLVERLLAPSGHDPAPGLVLGYY